MIDYNDTPEPVERNLDAEREEIRAALIANLESVLFTLFPAGKKRKGKFYTGDILGSPGDSLEIVVAGDKAGLWTDRATGQGGDIFDLISGHLSLNVHTDFAKVLGFAAHLVGKTPSEATRKRKAEPAIDELGPATAKWEYHDGEGK